MKKAHELAVLCDLKINISIFDPKLNTFVEFTTEPKFTVNEQVSKIKKMLSNESRRK